METIEPLGVDQLVDRNVSYERYPDLIQKKNVDREPQINPFIAHYRDSEFVTPTSTGMWITRLWWGLKKTDKRLLMIIITIILLISVMSLIWSQKSFRGTQHVTEEDAQKMAVMLKTGLQIGHNIYQHRVDPSHNQDIDVAINILNHVKVVANDTKPEVGLIFDAVTSLMKLFQNGDDLERKRHEAVLVEYRAEYQQFDAIKQDFYDIHSTFLKHISSLVVLKQLVSNVDILFGNLVRFIQNPAYERGTLEHRCKQYDPEATLDHIYRQQANIIEYFLTQNNRTILLHVMKALTGTQLNAVKLYEACQGMQTEKAASVTNFERNFKSRVADFMKRIENVTQAFRDADQDLKKNFFSKYGKQYIDQFLDSYSHLNVNVMADRLWDALKARYYWSQFLVFVFDVKDATRENSWYFLPRISTGTSSTYIRQPGTGRGAIVMTPRDPNTTTNRELKAKLDVCHATIYRTDQSRSERKSRFKSGCSLTQQLWDCMRKVGASMNSMLCLKHEEFGHGIRLDGYNKNKRPFVGYDQLETFWNAELTGITYSRGYFDGCPDDYADEDPMTILVN